MANTTWNPSDLSSISLSGGNLTATGTAVAYSGVRSINGYVGGAGAPKLYWEVTPIVTAGATYWGTGIANQNFVLNSDIRTGNNAAALYMSGTIIVNDSGLLSITAPTVGTPICIAVDLANSLIWFRSSPTGSWNASSGTANNPATGVGGLSISSIGGSAHILYGLFGVATTSDAGTANFGDSAFSGVVPSGFTAGFPFIPPNMQVTQTGIEHWAWSSTRTIPINVQVTQTGIEHWAPVPPATHMNLTQIGVEHWAAIISTANMDLTQIGVEHWAAIQSAAHMNLTQIGIEHWGTTASGSGGPGQPGVIDFTQVAIEEWVSINVTNPLTRFTQISIEEWVPTSPPGSPPPIGPGGPPKHTGGVWLIGL